MSRSLIAAAVLAMLATGCTDGKFNLLLVLWAEDEGSSSSSEETIPYSSSPSLYSSSSQLSSSGFSPSSPSSSSEEGQAPSSGSRGPRSSSSLNEVEYPPPIEEGAKDVKTGWASRYWDGCKPHCSRPEHVEDTAPWAICRNCDKNNNEMPTYYKHLGPDSGKYWPGEYLGTPSGCDPHDMNIWKESPDYNGSAAYTCWDMAPRIINDTLAYAFAATSMEESYCGKCFQLQFDGGDHYNPDKARDTHRENKEKTLVVMSSNVGGDVGIGQFDIMIPGGGLGAFTTGFPTQINVVEDALGKTMGGLLSTCISSVDYYKTSMEVLQECVREKCRNVFGSKAKELLDGCMFIADWYMAADNPTHVYKEVECPKYLVDKYRSTINTEKPPPLW
ncbi:MAG: hypothetical protein LBQ87_07005 [Candidatus Fibromonas sp.]|nr:hypothetical protein [Candidatus Fibromonas sp.]